MTILDIFRRIILLNELGGNPRAAYRFTDPDGPSGRSGWSFGLCQFDCSHNPTAIICLREIGFTTDEIERIRRQTLQPMAPLNERLYAAREIIDRYDEQQLSECLQHPSRLCTESGIRLDDSGLLACADYHNQFYMSRGGKLHTHLRGIKRPVTAEDIRGFKLTLPWGQKRPDDVARRHENIIRAMKEGGLL